MKKRKKLELGIEIIAGLHAEVGGGDMEYGRYIALFETEANPDELKELDEEQRERRLKAAQQQKGRLHRQALFVAVVAIAKLNFSDTLQVRIKRVRKEVKLYKRQKLRARNQAASEKLTALITAKNKHLKDLLHFQKLATIESND